MNENSGRLLRMIVLAFGGVESLLAGVLLSSRHAPDGDDGSVRRDRSGYDGFKTMKDMRQGMMTGTLPPGTDPHNLPEPESQGASVLSTYCAQCHNLPTHECIRQMTVHHQVGPPVQALTS